MNAQKLAVVLLVFAVASWMPMSGVAQDVSAVQNEQDDQGVTIDELELNNVTLDNVTIRNLSVGSLDVQDEEITNAPTSVENETGTVSATMQNVTFENLTIRDDTLADELLGALSQSLPERAENETVETGQEVRNATLNDTTIDGGVFESVVVENVTGNLSIDNASGEGQVGDRNETGTEPAIEAANVTIGHLNTTAVPAENQEDAEEATETETGVENATEAADGGASDDIIGDENVTQPNWANKTGNNETDVTGSGNWTNGTAGNGTQLGGEVGEDLTAENESNTTTTNASEVDTADETNATAGNETETSSGNASLNADR